MRLVIDVNVWISYLMGLPLRNRVNRAIESGITLLVSDEFWKEFRDTMYRPKFSRYFSPKDISILTETIIERAEMVVTTSKTDMCRDPNDNYLLALAKDGNADYLITGDKDLLALKQFGQTRILAFSDFEEQINI